MTMRMDEQPAAKGAGSAGKEASRSSAAGSAKAAKPVKTAEVPNAAMGNAFAQAFAKFKK